MPRQSHLGQQSVVSIIFASMVVLLSALEGCSRKQTPAPATNTPPAARGDTFADGTPRQRVEFERIAARLFMTDDRFFRRNRTEQIRRDMNQVGPDLQRRLVLSYDLVHQLLREGDADGAVAAIDEMYRVFGAYPQALEGDPSFLRLKGLVYLRLAEIENCINRHNADCCLFPLAGGGLHEVQQPAEMARSMYRAYLDARPDDLAVRWLLNITSMALGDHPEGLPEAQRIELAELKTPGDLQRFPDVAGALGIDTFNLCGGCIVDDFDGDGCLDIVTSTIDPEGPLTFYHNQRDGTFEDRSEASRLADQLGGLNIIGADYDNDGDVDVLVLRGAWLFEAGRIRNSLLRNNGDGTFTDVTRAAGLAEPALPTQAATWGDFDQDGDLDLFVANESRIDPGIFPPDQVAGGDYPSQLFLNNGDGTFTDVATAAGVTNDRYGKGVSAGDFDNDGDLDLYISNIGKNRLYRNEGDGTFTDVAPELGVTAPDERSFVSWFFDYDNDGWLDLFVAAYDARIADVAADFLGVEHNATSPRLYHNRGDGTFEDRTIEAGLDRPFLPMGANFGDLDNDGWLDFYLTTGDPSYESIMPNLMLRNVGGKAFADVSRAGGFGHLQKGHGVAFADLDNDGDQDIYHQLGGFYSGDAFRNALFHNPGQGNRFLSIRLVGAGSPRNGYGVRITVEIDTPDGPRQVHRAVGSVSSFGGSPARQELGLGNATAIRRLELVWPVSRAKQVFTDVPLDAMIEAVEGEAEFRTLDLPRLKF